MNRCRQPIRARRPRMLADPINSLSGRRLLVTGASGFIGARLCRRAVEEGAIVHALSRRPQGEAGEVRWERGDSQTTPLLATSCAAFSPTSSSI